MSLPSLKHLFLGSPPNATETGDSSLFFKHLHAPILETLQFFSVSAQDLSYLSVSPTLRTITLDLLQINNSTSAKTASSSLVDALKGCKQLTSIYLRLPTSTPSDFWIQLDFLLMSLSMEGFRSGYHVDQLLLPQFTILSTQF